MTDGETTGPRTPEGKSIASRNALRHGLRSRMQVLPDEDEQVFLEFRERLFAALCPESEVEVFLADRAILVAWRLQRVLRVEVGVFASYYFEEMECRARSDVQQYEVAPLSTLMERAKPWRASWPSRSTYCSTRRGSGWSSRSIRSSGSSRCSSRRV